ncbi:MAG: heparinase II/III family protein, partial [Candidatus Latescibacteria bacterium]|jgi:hypothetical protein|nr:heparinase II/III family protein [Candidatus Latescibacterota bacterium]
MVLMIAFVATLTVALATAAEAKECSRFVTAEMRANAVRNAERFEWVRREQEEAASRADPWVQLPDVALWDMVTSQELPRSQIFTSGVLYEGQRPRCPSCGDGILPYGNDPWRYDNREAPWKVRCPSCRELYPKNDFEAFYRTALDEHGMFRRALGDRTLLFNADHPDPDDPHHRVYVDDGYGMVDEKGQRYHPVACYNNHAQWRTVLNGLTTLARAYTLTDDRVYAHKAAVLLDRIADVYPEMDYLPLHEMGFQHSQGGTGRGRIHGCIAECSMGAYSAETYDLIYDGIQDDAELVAFCSDRARQFKLTDKSSVSAICAHIEDNLLLEMLGSVKEGQISGNTGATHVCLAQAAIALDRGDTTLDWLDWLFDPGFPGDIGRYRDPVPWVLVEGLDRDGMGGECGGYGLIWKGRMIELAEILASYPEYTRHSMVADYPKFRQCFSVEPRLLCLDAAIPHIGDCGCAGAWGGIWQNDPPAHRISARDFVRGYKLYRDPELANQAWHYARGKLTSLRLSEDIFERDPGALAEEIADAVTPEPFRLKSDHMGRYGQAVLQTEHKVDGRAVWIHYGGRKGHWHADCMNIGLYAKNIDMFPDLGYPEFTGSWPKRGAWTSNTISHNTLQVDDTRSSPGGRVELFAIAPPVRVIDVSSTTAYEGLEAYRRTVTLVDISETDSYVLDVFRARGGTNHRLSYHGPAETARVEGIDLVGRSTGTFAGPDVAFATLGEERDDPHRSSGFTYLYDIARSAGPIDTTYTVDWTCEDKRGRIVEGKEPHLRLHALTSCDEVALASGDPPQNRPNAPRRYRYLIQSRLGEDMQSQFITVLEPYDRDPIIDRVRALDVEHNADPNAVAAVAVELMNGTTDILISCEEPTAVTVEGGITFEGRFGMVRSEGGKVELMRMAHARFLRVGDVELTCEVPAYSGKVVRVDASDPQDNQVYLEPGLPQDAGLAGGVIHFRNEVPYDTSYDVKAVGDGWISTGRITTIAGFNDPEDFDSGYRYLVNPGDGYAVPVVVRLDR